jgi:pyridoxamine 5'-phosphate oxidase
MIDPTTLDPDPWRQFGAWLAEAETADVQLATAFALATADGSGAPSVRMVLLRGWDADGLRFYTDRRSRKGRDLAANPRAAAVFYWPQLDRQVRAFGSVSELGAATSLAYVRTRPIGSRASAWASHQGEPIPTREALEEQVRALDPQLVAEELPPHWGGYLLRPQGFEFWVSRADRLHDRVEYVQGADGTWTRRRLQP